jgi:hypothetical protein
MNQTKCVCGEPRVANLTTCGRLLCDRVTRSLNYHQEKLKRTKEIIDWGSAGLKAFEEKLAKKKE